MEGGPRHNAVGRSPAHADHVVTLWIEVEQSIKSRGAKPVPEGSGFLGNVAQWAHGRERVGIVAVHILENSMIHPFASGGSLLDFVGGACNAAIFCVTRTAVTAITARRPRFGDTRIVNMVRRRVRKSSLSRETRGSSGKGKPRLASFSKGSPVAARYRPPAPAAGPRSYLVKCKRPRRDVILRR